MGLLGAPLVVELLLAAASLLILLYLYTGRHFAYWKQRGVPHQPPAPFFGNLKDLVLRRVSTLDFFNDMYKAGKGEPYFGFVSGSGPGLLVRDPDIIKDMLTRDFSHFYDRGVDTDEKRQPLSAHLFAMEGLRWRNLRIKLTPTFTSGKMRMMFPLMRECADELLATLQPSASAGDVVEFKDLMARFTTDVIGSCAFGVSCNSLKDPDAEFRRIGMKIFQTSLRSMAREAVMRVLPRLGLLIPMDHEVERFFLDVVKRTVEHRENSGIKRNDFMQLLIEIRNRGKIVDNVDELKNDVFMGHAGETVTAHDMVFTESLMAAQVFVFFIAGFDTSSATLAFSILELACNPEVQERARQDVDAALQRHGGCTYEAMMDLPYIDKVVAETLRKYPPVSFLTRRCTLPYQIRGTKLTVEKGHKVFIPVYGLQHDPEIFPEPERFDPERFSPEAKAARHPFTYLPFGEGPRICIGMRFGQLQTKLGLATLLANFEFRRCDQTKMPMPFKIGGFLTQPATGIKVQVLPRSTPASQ